METLPTYIGIIFSLTTLFTAYLFAKASPKPKLVLSIIMLWLLVQAVISRTGLYYEHTRQMPPPFVLATFPCALTIIFLFVTRKGRRFIDGMDLKMLTILHIVRILVEIVLLWLFLHKVVPQVMTFEGRNFDILAGISAPVIYYIAFRAGRTHKKLLLIWNVIGILLLLNIVSIAVLSAPFPIQQLGFEQPNIAVLYFPFIWLPACVVPLVLFSHLASIRQLLKRKD